MGVHDAEERGRSAYIWYYGITNNMDTQEEERLPDEEIFDPEILPEWTGYLSARVWIDQDWGFWGGALQDFEVWTEAFLRWEGQLEFLFFVAARNGQVDMMKLFLQMGLERQRVLDMDDIHMPAAVHSGCLEAVKFLVDNGGNIHLLFYEAARQGQLEMFEYCLPKWLEHTDSNVLFEDAEDAKDAFLGAALGGHEKVVGLFLDRGIVHGNRGETEEVLINLALIEAAKKGHHATVQLLLNRGADDGRDEIVEVLSA
ncbi:hypothetical protein HK104_004580 [Borealophlyctis nickersoniae]|nr:hypothetical protein HK104_004580 [Borealophlyctis nickersoniae]